MVLTQKKHMDFLASVTVTIIELKVTYHLVVAFFFLQFFVMAILKIWVFEKNFFK